MPRRLEQDIFLEILTAAGTVDLLHPGALFQPQLRLAVRTAQIAMRFEVADLHVLALDEVARAAENIHEAAVLVQAFIDVLGQRTEDRHTEQQHDDDDHDGAACKQIDQIKHRCHSKNKVVELIAAVSVLHEFSKTAEKISHSYHPIQPI